MVISGIVFGISHSAYLIVSKQFYRYKVNSEITGELSLFNTTLTKDFSEAKEIRKSGNGLLMLDKHNLVINYQFESDYITRRVNEVKHRFSVSSSNLQMLIFGKTPSGNGLIDELSFASKFVDKTLPFHFKKPYGKDVLMELENQ
ncbi:MAG: hypothetical protein COA57_04875 [Flavobacteriales bacterium]|nr:MAG: hypothetical protein COA57_04875 [Flavobacteriales bacterium]